MSFQAWTPTYWEPEQAFEGYRGFGDGLLFDPRGDFIRQTMMSPGGSSANIVAKTSMPAAPAAAPPAVITASHAEVPWLDRELVRGVKNLYLVAGGAVVAAGIGFLALRKKKSVAGYRRRSRR